MEMEGDVDARNDTRHERDERGPCVCVCVCVHEHYQGIVIYRALNRDASVLLPESKTPDKPPNLIRHIGVREKAANACDVPTRGSRNLVQPNLT